jgi:gamma-glutamylcysteine synthetase
MVNIVLISLILSNSNKMKNIEQERGNENNNIIIVEAVKPDIIAIEKYKELSNFFEVNNLSFKNMIITKGNLEIDIEVKSYEEYIYVVRCIENHYSIKRLAPNIKNEGNFDFKVILEV